MGGVIMLFALIFAHSPADCPATQKHKMEEFARLLLPETLREAEITLIDGYVDKLCLAPEDKDHFSHFAFELKGLSPRLGYNSGARPH